MRATGSGLAYNSGRFATAVGVLLAGFLFSALDGDYSRVGALCAIVYALGALPIANAHTGPADRMTSGIVDCQSHLFFPEVIELMRKRKTDPLVYDRDGTTYLKMGDWLRRVPPQYLSVEVKLASMNKSGIGITLLSNNDPGPEWFGDDGPAVAQVVHDSLASVIAKYPTRFRGLCTLPLQNEATASAELDRCVKKLGLVGILLYTQPTTRSR